MTLVSFLFFTGLVAALSYYLTHRDDHESATGYFLAGRSLGWLVIGGSLLLTNLSTEQLVGLNGGGYEHGMQVMAWEVVSAIAMVIAALVFLPRYLASGITTVPQFLELRYNHVIRLIISILLLLSLLTNLLPFVLYSGALFMSEVFDVPDALSISETSALWVLVVSLGVVGGIYAIFGGLKAVAVSDTLNGAGLLIGGLSIPILALIHLGDGSLSDGLNTVTSNEKQLLDPVGPEDGNIPFSTLFTGLICITVYYWCTNQAIVQRTFGARSLEQGQKGVLFAAGMKLLGPFYLVLPGIIAFHLFGTTEAGSDFLELASKDQAYGKLVTTILPTWMIGFFSAVIFGAILSSFNSGLNSATTLFSVDIYKGWINPDADEATMVRVGKTFGLLVGIGAMLVAPQIARFEGGLFDLMKQLAALYNIPLLAITIVGIFSKRVPAAAAGAAIVSGVVFYAIFGLTLGNTVFGYQMSWLHVAGLNMALCVSVMLIWGAIRPLPEPFQQQYSEDVDITPWRLAKPLGLAVCIAVVVMYAWLHAVAT